MFKNKKRINNLRHNYPFIDSDTINRDTYYDYIDRMTFLALSIFEWVNLPETIDGDFLELLLFYYGDCTLLFDDKLRLHCYKMFI